jgi:hypothetical protein
MHDLWLFAGFWGFWMRLSGFWSRSGSWGRRAREHLGVAAWHQHITGSALSKVSSRQYNMCVWCQHTSCSKYHGKCMILSTCLGNARYGGRAGLHGGPQPGAPHD